MLSGIKQLKTPKFGIFNPYTISYLPCHPKTLICKYPLTINFLQTLLLQQSPFFLPVLFLDLRVPYNEPASHKFLTNLTNMSSYSIYSVLFLHCILIKMQKISELQILKHAFKLSLLQVFQTFKSPRIHSHSSLTDLSNSFLSHALRAHISTLLVTA